MGCLWAGNLPDLSQFLRVRADTPRISAASFMEKYVDFIIIRLPIVGNLSKELNTARTTGTMSSLLLSGVSITRAIEITEDVVQNVYYKKILKEAKEEVEKGAPFSKVFEENPNLFPVMMSEMIQVGEETGKLDEILQKLGNFYAQEVDAALAVLTSLI